MLRSNWKACCTREQRENVSHVWQHQPLHKAEAALKPVLAKASELTEIESYPSASLHRSEKADAAYQFDLGSCIKRPQEGFHRMIHNSRNPPGYLNWIADVGIDDIPLRYRMDWLYWKCHQIFKGRKSTVKAILSLFPEAIGWKLGCRSAIRSSFAFDHKGNSHNLYHYSACV